MWSFGTYEIICLLCQTTFKKTTGQKFTQNTNLRSNTLNQETRNNSIPGRVFSFSTRPLFVHKAQWGCISTQKNRSITNSLTQFANQFTHQPSRRQCAFCILISKSLFFFQLKPSRCWLPDSHEQKTVHLSCMTKWHVFVDKRLKETLLVQEKLSDLTLRSFAQKSNSPVHGSTFVGSGFEHVSRCGPAGGSLRAQTLICNRNAKCNEEWWRCLWFAIVFWCGKVILLTVRIRRIPNWSPLKHRKFLFLH